MKINKINLTIGKTLSIQRTGWNTSQHDALIYAFIDEVKNHPEPNRVIMKTRFY